MSAHKKVVKLSNNVKMQIDGLNGSITLDNILAAAFQVDYARREGKKAGEGLSGYMLDAAKRFDNVEGFTNQCDIVERSFKSMTPEGFKAKYGFEATLTKKGEIAIPACWSQYKHNLVKGWSEFDLDPKEYETESAFRKDLTEARKATKASPIKEQVEKVQIPAQLAECMAELARLYAEGTDDMKEAVMSGLSDTLDRAVVAGLSSAVIEELGQEEQVA